MSKQGRAIMGTRCHVRARPMNNPNLVSLGSINEDGSRKFIHPSDTRGPFTLGRRVAGAALLVVYAALPWIPLGGHPAVFLDVAHRRFHFMGLTFATQELWVGFFLITGVAFSLFYVTALFGRLWCGWACPYTVFLEHVYRRVERLIDGDAPARKRLASAPWSPSKISKRALKHAIYIAVSALIAHVFLSYFVSLAGLYDMMSGPPREHLTAFGVVLFLTGALYFSFSWFREQFCIILCPYGRLQSALTDDNTINVGYDKKRGEPRGKVGTEGAGSCIGCNRCVQVCPTGIDIRNGLQLECVGCAACIDACDDIMTKVNRPKGLIRYDSLNGLEGGATKFIRPRTIFYTILLIAGMAAFAISTRFIQPFQARAVRMVGPSFYLADGMLRNQFNLRLINPGDDTTSFHVALEIEGLPPSITLAENLDEVAVGPLGEEVRPIILAQPVAEYKPGVLIRLRVTDKRSGKSTLTERMTFQGPDPRLMIIK